MNRFDVNQREMKNINSYYKINDGFRCKNPKKIQPLKCIKGYSSLNLDRIVEYLGISLFFIYSLLLIYFSCNKLGI